MAQRHVLDVDIDVFNHEMASAPPPTVDDQTLLYDGRRLDSPEKVLNWYVEIGAMTETEAREFLTHH